MTTYGIYKYGLLTKKKDNPTKLQPCGDPNRDRGNAAPVIRLNECVQYGINKFIIDETQLPLPGTWKVECRRHWIENLYMREDRDKSLIHMN